MKDRQPRSNNLLSAKTGLRYVGLLLVGLLLTGCGKPVDRGAQMLDQTAHQVISPLYADLYAQSQQLFDVSKAFCSAPKQLPQTLEALQQQWRNTMLAWARVQPIGFGPVEEGNWRWKIQFWPDRKDITRKKVESLIASDDALTAERVAAASVSVQGLVALEYLLFDSRGSDLAGYQQNARRCELQQAIAERLQKVSGLVLSEWREDYANSFAQPGEANSRYPELEASLADLLNSLVVGTEVVKRNKLGLPIATGKGAGYAKPYRLEAWRSQYSLELMKASTQTLEKLYRSEGAASLGDYLRAQPDVDETKLDAVEQAFAVVNEQFSQLQGPLFSQIKQPDYYAKLVALHSALAELQRSLSELPGMLDISLGFNSNDGD